MKHIFFTLILGLLLLDISPVNAQSTTVENVLDIKSQRQSGPIVEGEEIIGYYIFYFKEKADRKNSTYEVEIFDNDYRSVQSFEITRPKKTILRDVTFNGEVFIIEFFDAKLGFEFITVDKTGEEIGKLKLSKKQVSKREFASARYSTFGSSNRIHSNGKNGFIAIFKNSNKKTGYQVVAWDNELNEVWKIESPESGMYETFDINEITDKLMTATIWKQKNATTAKMDFSFILMDPKTGEIINEVSTGNAKEGKRSVHKSYIDQKSERIYLVGEYYRPKDDMYKDKSLGLYIMELDLTGEIIATQNFTWREDIDRLAMRSLNGEEMKDYKESFQFMIHNIIRSEDGSIFIVGEQYRKQVSAAGVGFKMAAAAMGGSTTAGYFEILINNMILIELDSEFNLEDFQLIEKKKTRINLEDGYGMWYGSTRMGYFIKAMGGFDYAFTSVDSDRDEYTVIYTDYNRKEDDDSKKSDIMLGVIHIKDGEAKASRVPINSDAKSVWINAAKPGNISITEYYKKEKLLEMRLERIAY